MMTRNFVTFLLAATAVFSQQQAALKADACAPPPGAVPPMLPAKLLPGMGMVNFPITTASAEAQAFFNQGVAQMHSFWAREAERSFLQAAKLDPEAPMPQWGIAMVASGDYRPGFQLDLVNGLNPNAKRRTSKPQGGEARAIAAAQKAHELAAVPGKATELEKLYIGTVIARRDVSQRDPNAGYVQGWRTLLSKFPREVEARSYLALHLMSGFELPAKTPRAGSMEAVTILRELLHEAPEHPGVHHYVIHGWEGSTFAKEAWPSCERYGAIARNIPHGLHMPGHIYAQTGKWQEAIRAFASAAENEVYWMKQDSLAGNGHHGHNVHFLAASYSFSGDYEKAMAAARSLLDYTENPREAAQLDNFRTAWRQGWFSVLRTLVQHEKWAEILDDKTLPIYDKPRESAWRHWAVGLAFLNTGKVEDARRELAAMDKSLALYKSKVKQAVPAPLSVAREELKAHLTKNVDTRLARLDRAARRERALRYNEPPQYPRPVFEAMGQLALRNGKAQIAEKAFRQALDQYPESARAKTGLRASIERQNRPVEAGF
ncbi:MAG: tetratricopeptide repeat protein [Bryobacterales bacterium]|nr:tetratricopeptide repeat protein [Bryobacterales bacterium]